MPKHSIKIKKFLEKSLHESFFAKNSVLQSIDRIDFAVLKLKSTILKGGKILLCGNGGSAADAQHLAAELLVRLRPSMNRRPLPAISLALDTSTITACGMIIISTSFKGKLDAVIKCDLLIAILLGNSKNINVLKQNKKKFSICFWEEIIKLVKNCDLP